MAIGRKERGDAFRAGLGEHFGKGLGLFGLALFLVDRLGGASAEDLVDECAGAGRQVETVSVRDLAYLRPCAFICGRFGSPDPFDEPVRLEGLQCPYNGIARAFHLAHDVIDRWLEPSRLVIDDAIHRLQDLEPDMAEGAVGPAGLLEFAVISLRSP